MKFIKFLGIMFLLFSFGISINMYRFDYNLNDGFWRTLMIPFEGTVWAPGFSENNFTKMQLGMSEAEVHKLLGNPLDKDKDCKKLCFWSYTLQDTGTADFDQRWVVFAKNKRVTEIRKSFFID